MPDRIIGQPTNLTTVTDNGAGFCRVTFAPWELDWEFYLAITPGVDFLANTTVGNTSLITARGGAENLGYWFDTDRAFPGGWATGNRCSPQRQAAILQHATFAAAIAAMAVHDVFLVWYQNTANLRIWTETCSFAGISGSVWGMLSRNQTCKAGSSASPAISYTGNLAAQVQQVFVRNITVPNCGNYHGILHNPTLGAAGAGVRVTRCEGVNVNFFADAAGTAAGTIQIDNCVVLSGNILPGAFRPLHLLAGTGNVYFCTLWGATGGFYLLAGCVGRNLVAAETFTCFVGADYQNCADTDGTLPVHATNLRNQDMRTQLRFFYDLARPGDKAFGHDFRIHQDSVLNGAGVAVAGLTFDKDGQLRPDPPSIGAYEPYSTCYAPAAEIVRGAGRRGAGA